MLGCLAVMEPGVAAMTAKLVVVEPRPSVVDAAAMVQLVVGSWLPLAVVEIEQFAAAQPRLAVVVAASAARPAAAEPILAAGLAPTMAYVTAAEARLAVGIAAVWAQPAVMAAAESS